MFERIKSLYGASDLSSFPNLLVFKAFADERGKMREELIHKFLYEIEHALSSAVLGFENNRIYGFCSEVSFICIYVLPEKVCQNLSVLSFILAIKIDTVYQSDVVHILIF